MHLSIHYLNSIRAFRNIHIKVCPFYWNAFWQRRLVLPNIPFCIACPERRFSRLDLVMKLEQIAIAFLEPEHCRNFAQQCCNTIAWNNNKSNDMLYSTRYSLFKLVWTESPLTRTEMKSVLRVYCMLRLSKVYTWLNVQVQIFYSRRVHLSPYWKSKR